MNLYILPLLLSLLFTAHEQIIIEKDFEKHFKEYNVEGSFLLLDLNRNEFTSYNKKRCEQGFLPASTFKIPNSLFFLEAGILTPADTIYWNGEESWNPDWNKNHVLKSAFSTSCVPCYQQYARKLGPAKMQEYLEKARYGKMDVNPATIDSFWLTGNSRISQFEQIDFLTRLYKNELPFSKENMELVKDIMVMEKNDKGVLSAKTGLTRMGDNYVGWFVGYVEKEGNTYFFATNVEKAIEEDNSAIISSRKAITLNILEELGLY